MTRFFAALCIAMTMGCMQESPGADDLARITMNGDAGASEKCSAWGYRGDSLSACVHAIRADFCGDGSSLTLPGVQIDIYDTEGVISDTQDWAVEAEWNEGGAACILSPELTRFSRIAHVVPSCFIPIDDECGSGGRGSLITKLPPTFP